MISERGLYLHRLLNEFADGMIKAFIPVIIYAKTNSISACLAFIIGYYLLQSFLNYVLYKPATQRPIVFIFIRILPILLTQFLLLGEFSVEWLVIGFILSYSLSNVLYWTPINFLFSQIARKEVGKKTGRFEAISIGGKLLAPVVSGFILTYSEMWVLVGIAVCMYILSLWVLVRPSASTIEPPPSAELPPDQMPKPIPKQKSSLGLFLFSYALIGLFDTAEVFWALYIYDVSINFFYVGIASTLIQFGIIASNLISGKITDRKKWVTPAIIALLLFAATWILRGNTQHVILIFFVSAMAGLLKPIFSVPIFSNFIMEANASGQPQRWIAWREIMIKVGGLASAGAVVIFGNLLVVPFYASALAALVMVRQLRVIYQLHIDQIKAE